MTDCKLVGVAMGCDGLRWVVPGCAKCARLAKIQSRPKPRLAESHMSRKPEISMFLDRPDRALPDAARKISV